MTEKKRHSDSRRGLPSVSEVLETEPLSSWASSPARGAAVHAVRSVLERHRSLLQSGDDAPPVQDLAREAQALLEDAETDRLRPVINATGILLHTGLGRAVLPGCAVDALAELKGYCNLQIDLETGRRGKRNFATERLLTELTGAEAALVVNNNAAATLLVLTALCRDRDVVVSRGQLIEIGGSYRLPDCIHQSGAILREVGTTNKTHLRDYEAVLCDATAAILRVNPSNYRIVGFAHQASIQELAKLKQGCDLLLIDDLGCGALVDLGAYGLPSEPTVQESLAAGSDLVLFSGDKLIGGPQAGIIAGRKDLVTRIRKHPLTRMLRVGKLTDLALEQTLRFFLCPDDLGVRHPLYRMLSMPRDMLAQRATRVMKELARAGTAVEARITEGESAVGGGALPATTLPTVLVCVRSAERSAEGLCGRLRRNEPPIVARIREDEVIFDMRTLQHDGEADQVGGAMARIALEKRGL